MWSTCSYKNYKRQHQTYPSIVKSIPFVSFKRRIIVCDVTYPFTLHMTSTLVLGIHINVFIKGLSL